MQQLRMLIKYFPGPSNGLANTQETSKKQVIIYEQKENKSKKEPKEEILLGSNTDFNNKVNSCYS